jgi:hypothetical protein
MRVAERGVSLLALLSSLVATEAWPQVCKLPGSLAPTSSTLGAGLEWGEGYGSVDALLSRRLRGPWFGAVTVGFTYSDVGDSGPLAGLAVEYRSISLAEGQLLLCPYTAIRHDRGMESATDFSLGLDIRYPFRRVAIMAGVRGVYQRYSLRRPQFAKGDEWFGTAEAGVAVRVSPRSWLNSGIRGYFGYGLGRRPSLILRWTLTPG